MRRLVGFLLLLITLLAPGPAALSFGTVNIPGSGQSAEHEKITRRSLPDVETLTLNQWAGRTGSFGAVGAPDKFPQSLFYTAEAHCDDGDYFNTPGYPQTLPAARNTLTGCRAWMTQHMNAAITTSAPLAAPTAANTNLNCDFAGSLGPPAGSVKCEVLRSFGLVFHAAQDFYSHTNWADKPDPSKPISVKNPPGLGDTGVRAPWLDLHGGVPFPAGLISGCYADVIETTNCNYGVAGIYNRVKHDYLNKDKGAVNDRTFLPGLGTTDRGKINGNFASAINAATDDTISKWAYFKERVRATYPPVAAEMIICAVRRDDYRECLNTRQSWTEWQTPPPPPVYERVTPITPPRFCTEAERLRYLQNSFYPYRDRLAAEWVKADSYLRALEQRLRDIERIDDGNPYFAEPIRQKIPPARADAAAKRAALDAADALGQAIRSAPLIACPQGTTGTTVTPPPPRPPPPLPPGFNRPMMERVGDFQFKQFCTERERLAYLVDVVNPIAAAASRNAVEASGYMKRLADAIIAAQRARRTNDAQALQAEHDAYAPIADTIYKLRDTLVGRRDDIAKAALLPCAKEVAIFSPPPPILVGPNDKVGSGARARDKVVGTALGIVGGFLGGGGGGGSDGPPLASCRVRDRDMTAFTDTITGTKLTAAARRSGDTVTVFAEVAQSADNGTFQTAYLQNMQGELEAPHKVEMCELWGEWKLSVSWARTTYVDGQRVSRESGGFQRAGRTAIRGMTSPAAAPDGLWRQLGFSSASHGARKIAMEYRIPKGALTDPVAVVVQVTRPKQDPVETVPFMMLMREGANGLTVEPLPVAPPQPSSGR